MPSPPVYFISYELDEVPDELPHHFPVFGFFATAITNASFWYEYGTYKKYKYLFGHDQSIDKQNCDYEFLKIVYDKDLGKWIVFYPNSVGGTGDIAKTTIDGAYSDQGNLDIVTSEVVNNKTNTVTLTFRFDEEVNHYVFVKRLVE